MHFVLFRIGIIVLNALPNMYIFREGSVGWRGEDMDLLCSGTGVEEADRSSQLYVAFLIRDGGREGGKRKGSVCCLFCSSQQTLFPGHPGRGGSVTTDY